VALIYPLGLASTDFSDGESTSGWQPESFVYGADITIPGDGTVTQLGVKTRGNSGGSVALKVGLYTSGGVLVAQTTATALAGGSAAWVDSGSISASVSAGTYYVLVSAANNQAVYGYDTSGNGSFATEANATAMAATETITAGGDVGFLYGVRADFSAAVTFTSHPTQQSAAAGATATFTSVASGSPTYQWQSAPITDLYSATPGTWSNIGGATSANYTTPTLTSADNGLWYRVIATDGSSTTSSPARLFITGLGVTAKGKLLDGWLSNAPELRTLESTDAADAV
jgi:hypothetical protein